MEDVSWVEIMFLDRVVDISGPRQPVVRWVMVMLICILMLDRLLVDGCALTRMRYIYSIFSSPSPVMAMVQDKLETQEYYTAATSLIHAISRRKITIGFG